ncbi:MAG: hypothetical protein PHV61_10805 [Limnochordia bacterium]|nr:hypothetical protein [Limnochordia bacterium]
MKQVTSVLIILLVIVGATVSVFGNDIRRLQAENQLLFALNNTPNHRKNSKS